MKPSEVIRAAIPLMERGWCRSALADKQGNVCALGALNQVVYGDPCSWGMYATPENQALHATAVRELNAKTVEISPRELSQYAELIDYNNYVALDVDDMVNLFEKAAQDLEVQGK